MSDRTRTGDRVDHNQETLRSIGKNLDELGAFQGFLDRDGSVMVGDLLDIFQAVSPLALGARHGFEAMRLAWALDWSPEPPLPRTPGANLSHSIL